MSIPIDGEELMDISEEGLIETSVISTYYLTSHRIDDVSEPTEDFVGANDIVVVFSDYNTTLVNFRLDYTRLGCGNR